MMEHYCVPEFNDSLEFLAHLAKRTGKLKKGLFVCVCVFRRYLYWVVWQVVFLISMLLHVLSFKIGTREL